MSCSGSPKVEHELAKGMDAASISDTKTEATTTDSPSKPNSPSKLNSPPKPDSPTKASNESPKEKRSNVTPKKSNSSPVLSSAPKDGEDSDTAEAKGKSEGSPESDTVFDGKGDASVKSGGEKSRARSRSFRRYGGLRYPPFLDNYYKPEKKSETAEPQAEEKTDDAEKEKENVPKHDRPGFFVGRTRRQSEKSTTDGKNDAGDNPQQSRKPRARRRPPPQQDYYMAPPGNRGSYRGSYRQFYQPQPYYQSNYGNYYQGQSYQQRQNYNRGIQRGFSYPPNYGRFNPPQYPPHNFSNQGFYDNFGGEQPKTQRKRRNRRKSNRSRTSSRRDRVESTASVKTESREIKIQTSG